MNLNSYKKHSLINVKDIANDLDNLSKSIETDLVENKKNHPKFFR